MNRIRIHKQWTLRKENENMDATKFSKVTQVGFVVRDMDKAIAGMKAIFGAEPKLATLQNPENKYRGQPSDCVAQLAYFNFANIELEFIMPISGKSIWQDFLDEGHEGIHHVRFEVDDNATATKAMTDKGITIYAQGPSLAYPGKQWTYFDTFDQLRFIVEMINTA
ncbi:MAG TPA: hypothetical protein GXX76_02595, partial [Bacteroidales bacterium]|nr:hypothetical protein [Bacteroidales bacterium]